MGNFMPVAKAGELADSTMKEVTVQGRPILLAKVGDRYYAADGRCPHMGGILAQGKLEGTVVTCPRHSSQFDLTDGHVVRWLKGSGLISAIGKALKSPRPLTVYQVKVEKDDILVEL
jgi:3-phenylpropionate/trans-cinnamate dioxygenase ferredoxin subunit